MTIQQTPADATPKAKPADKSAGDVNKKSGDMKKEHGSDCGC